MNDNRKEQIQKWCENLSNIDKQYIQNKLNPRELTVYFMDGSNASINIINTTTCLDIVLNLKKRYNQLFKLFHANNEEFTEENSIESTYFLKNLQEPKLFALPLNVYNIFIITNNKIQCMNSESESKWTFDLQSGKHGEIYQYSISSDGMIMIGAYRSGKIIGLNTHYGTVMWKYDQEYRIDTNPLIHNNTVYIVTQCTLISFDLITGSLNWTIQLSQTEYTTLNYIDPFLSSDKKSILMVNFIKQTENQVISLHHCIYKYDSVQSYNKHGHMNGSYINMFKKYGEFNLVKSNSNGIILIYTQSNYLIAWDTNTGIIWEKFIHLQLIKTCLHVSGNDIIIITGYDKNYNAQIMGITQKNGATLFEFKVWTLPMSLYMTNSIERLIIVLYYNNIYVYNTDGKVLYRHPKNECSMSYHILPNETSLIYYYHDNSLSKNANKKVICMDLLSYKRLWEKTLILEEGESVNSIKSAYI